MTLEKLIEKCGISSDQLNSEIEGSDMIILASYFDNVEYYLDILGLTPAEQSDVRRNNYIHGTQVAIKDCLLLWKQHYPFTATLRALLEILLRLRKEEIALKVCNFYCPKPKSSCVCM